MPNGRLPRLRVVDSLRGNVFVAGIGTLTTPASLSPPNELQLYSLD